MRKELFLKLTALLLVAVLLTLTFSACGKKAKTDNEILDSELNGTEYKQTAYDTIADPKDVKKEESVYINLKSSGEVYRVNVTDWLHTPTPQVRIADVSDLENIQNVNTLTEPVRENDMLYWDMDTTDLYYSGQSKKNPPVNFTVQYFLNGEELSAEDIAGKAGDVAIKITLTNTLEQTVTVDKKNYEVITPMLVAGGTILPEDTFSNIAIDYGTAVSDGAKQLVFFAGIPGMDESLGLSELNLAGIDKAMYTNTYTITAHTESFKLGNMLFAVMPFSSIGSVGKGGLTDGIDGIKDLLTDMERVQAAMEGLDMQKIIDLLYGDSAKVKRVMNTVTDAANLYTENEKMLKVLGSYMTEDNIKKLDKLMVDLEKTDMDAVSKTLSDPKLKMLLMLLPQLSQSLSNVSELAADLNDVMPIFRSLSKEMEDPEIQKCLEDLPKTLKRLNDIITVLNKNKEVLAVAGAFVSPDNQQYVQTLTDTAEKYANLGSLSEAQINALSKRAKAWLQSGSSYDIFTNRPENVKSTVMFAYKTDAIDAPKQEEAAEGEEAQSGNKFVAWCKRVFLGQGK